jgi:hypothetical protein
VLFRSQYLASDSVTIDLNDSNISNHEGVNISGLLQNWNGRLIFILENNGSPQLQYSDETATNMELNEDGNEAPTQVENYNSARYAAIWFAIMLILIAPAIILWVKETKPSNQSILEQE